MLKEIGQFLTSPKSTWRGVLMKYLAWAIIGALIAGSIYTFAPAWAAAIIFAVGLKMGPGLGFLFSLGAGALASCTIGLIGSGIAALAGAEVQKEADPDGEEMLSNKKKFVPFNLADHLKPGADNEKAKIVAPDNRMSDTPPPLYSAQEDKAAYDPIESTKALLAERKSEAKFDTALAQLSQEQYPAILETAAANGCYDVITTILTLYSRSCTLQQLQDAREAANASTHYTNRIEKNAVVILLNDMIKRETDASKAKVTDPTAGQPSRESMLAKQAKGGDAGDDDDWSKTHSFIEPKEPK